MSIEERKAIEAKTGIESPGRFKVYIGEITCGTRVLDKVGVLMFNQAQIGTVNLADAAELAKVLDYATKTWCETKL